MSLDELAAPGSKCSNKTVEGELLFLEPDGRRPFVSFTYGSGGSETNATYSPRTVLIRDGRAVGASLDVQGFELVRHASSVTDFYNDAQVQSTGRAEAAQVVAQATGAARVHVFDHTRRRRSPDAPRQPSTRVHNDYTAKSATARVRDLLRAEADALLKRPFAFINLWRPIRWPAADWPLALCDARSVAPDDLIATDIIYPDRRGEIYGAVYSPRQRWFYFHEMQLDEALLIKCYDTRPGVSRFAPHTAFESRLTPPAAPARESVEFRTIAFFD